MINNEKIYIKFNFENHLNVNAHILNLFLKLRKCYFSHDDISTIKTVKTVYSKYS